MERSKLFSAVGFLVVIGLIVAIPGRKWARSHVNSKTATTDHPLLCTSCHLYTQKTGVLSKMINAKYLSPFNLAVSGDGKVIYVVAQEANALLIVDAEKQKVLDKIMVGLQPYQVVLSKDGQKAYVSNQWSDNVSVIDLASRKVIDTLLTGNGPAGLSLSSDGQSLYAVNSYSSDLSVIDLHNGNEIRRLPAGNNPTGIKLSPDGKVLFVTSRRADLNPYGTPVVSELTIVNDSTKKISQYKKIVSAYMMENVAFTPQSDMGFITLIRPKNLVPSIQVEQGFMMTHGFGIVDLKNNGRVIQLLLDEPNEYYSDPYGIAITPDGKRAFISSAGVDRISVVDIDSVRKLIAGASPAMLNTYSDDLGASSHYIIKRIPTGANPKGLALSPDGKLLYVAELLEDKIAVINTQSLETIGSIDLGGPGRITVARQGRRLFNNASHTFSESVLLLHLPS